MEFLLGTIVGLLVSILILVSLMFFRRTIEQKSTILEAQIGNMGPRPRGLIIEPEDEAELTRQQIIDRNRKNGRDTHISELYEENY